MLATYRAAFRAPGSAAFAGAGFVMRLPIAIYPLGLVLIVSAKTGHYGFAGVLTGIYVAANGVGTPTLARLVDRFGQGRVLLPATALHVMSVAALGGLVHANAPQWTFIAPVTVAGFAYLSVGSLIRARWSFVLAGMAELSTAYSLESTLDEVVFTLGPLIATVLATQFDPLVVLLVAAILVAAGAVWLRTQRATEPPRPALGSDPHASALRAPGMVLLTIAAVGMGGVFASAEVTMVAFCGQHGHRAASGFGLAAFAFGSAVAGFAYGSRHRAAPMLDRFRLQAILFALLPLIFLAALDIPVLVGCAFVVGLGIAPTLITAFGLIEQIVPAAALTEGLAWLITGISLGYGAGSSVVGRMADAFGARTAFTVTIGSGLVVGIVALVLYTRLSRADAESRAVAVG